MIALKGYVRNLFEGFEVDEAVEEYILIDIPFKHKNIFGGGGISFNFERCYIDADLPVSVDNGNIIKARKFLLNNGIIITSEHTHIDTIHYHFDLSLIKENIDKIYNLFFNLREKINV